MYQYEIYIRQKRLSNCDEIRACNHIIRKRTLNDLAKLSGYDFTPASNKTFLNIQVTTECIFKLKRVCDMIRTHRQKCLTMFPCKYIWIFHHVLVACTWDWHNSFAVTLAQLFPSDTDAFFSKWHLHDCCQVRLARFFPTENSTIVAKWYWYYFFQVWVAWLFTSDTGPNFSKWHWHNRSQVRLVRLFPSVI